MAALIHTKEKFLADMRIEAKQYLDRHQQPRDHLAPKGLTPQVGIRPNANRAKVRT
ncbi:MAG: hypothetical protein VYA99_07435 [Pseudomonadota bacterium]|nr:hypothetical protein [Pseudomonadota bacterium]